MAKEQRVDNADLETRVKRLMRRSQKTTSAIIAPFPISSLGDLDHMFAAGGKVNKIIVRIDEMPKSGVVVSITTDCYDGSIMSQEFKVKKKFVVFPNIDTLEGDAIRVSVTQVKPEEELKEYRIGMLWTPSIKESEMKSFLIDELDKLEASYNTN